MTKEIQQLKASLAHWHAQFISLRQGPSIEDKIMKTKRYIRELENEIKELEEEESRD